MMVLVIWFESCLRDSYNEQTSVSTLSPFLFSWKPSRIKESSHWNLYIGLNIWILLLLFDQDFYQVFLNQLNINCHSNIKFKIKIEPLNNFRRVLVEKYLDCKLDVRCMGNLFIPTDNSIPLHIINSPSSFLSKICRCRGHLGSVVALCWQNELWYVKNPMTSNKIYSYEWQMLSQKGLLFQITIPKTFLNFVLILLRNKTHTKYSFNSTIFR